MRAGTVDDIRNPIAEWEFVRELTGKKIVVCLDGTGNQLGANNPTNVAKIFQLLDMSDPSKQIAYYDPGVGTMSSASARGGLGRAASRLSGLAFGTGMKTNLAEAYTYLMQHWQRGDSIYIFGFSRGAYTARALAGMLIRPGLMRPGSENLVPYAVAKYAINRDFKMGEYKRIAEFSRAFCWRTEGEPLFSSIKRNDPGQIWHHAVPVAYLGLWDTVKAAGILRLGDLQWLYTRALPNAVRIRHAVSIDERRRPYREYLVEPKKSRTEGLEEVWFAGIHSDVGGTFEPDHKLATIALKWIVDGVHSDLILGPGAYAETCTVDDSFALGQIHRMGRIWLLAGLRRRGIPPGAILHASVKMRRDKESNYPRRKSALPENQVWADLKWTEPSA
jgi:uncharacterized protein (DUF2235 family)